MAMLHVLRVFTGDDGAGGNPLGVFLDGPAIEAERRQDVAADLGFPETVFVDDAQRGRVAVFTPAVELGFAGHPLVGTAWLLASEGRGVDTLRPPAGEVATMHREGKLGMGPKELKARVEEQLETKAPKLDIDWNGWDSVRRRGQPGAIDEHTFGMLRGLEEKKFAPTSAQGKDV